MVLLKEVLEVVSGQKGLYRLNEQKVVEYYDPTCVGQKDSKLQEREWETCYILMLCYSELRRVALLCLWFGSLRYFLVTSCLDFYILLSQASSKFSSWHLFRGFTLPFSITIDQNSIVTSISSTISNKLLNTCLHFHSTSIPLPYLIFLSPTPLSSDPYSFPKPYLIPNLSPHSHHISLKIQSTFPIPFKSPYPPSSLLYKTSYKFLII